MVISIQESEIAEKMEHSAGKPPMLGTGEATNLPTTLQKLYSQFEGLNDTIDALLKSEPNDDERKRLEELKKLLTQTKEEIEQHASKPRFNKKMAALPPYLARFLDGLKTDFDTLLSDAEPAKGFMVANTLHEGCDLAKLILKASTPRRNDIQFNTFPPILEHSSHTTGKITANTVGVTSYALVILLVCLMPGASSSLLCLSFLLTPILSYFIARLVHKLFVCFDLYLPGLQKLAESFERKSVHENFPALTARKITTTLRCDNNHFLCEDFSEASRRLTTYIYAKDEPELRKACETLLKNNAYFLITKNNGTAKGYVIGTSSTVNMRKQFPCTITMKKPNSHHQGSPSKHRKTASKPIPYITNTLYLHDDFAGSVSFATPNASPGNGHNSAYVTITINTAPDSASQQTAGHQPAAISTAGAGEFTLFHPAEPEPEGRTPACLLLLS